MKTNICAECGREFKAKGGLHLHLKKAHGMTQEEYYHKHAPRYDIRTGELLKYKDLAQYSSALFSDKRSEYAYIRSCGYSGRAQEILDDYMQSTLKKNKGRFPTYCEWKSYPNMGYDQIPSFQKFHDKWNKKGLKYFGTPEVKPSKGRVIVDTREQKPLFEGEKQGINVGDYILEPRYYTGVHVDRKSHDDCILTFNGKNFERFRKEASKARTLGVKLVVLVEASLAEVYNTRPKSFTKQKTNGKTTLFNVRALTREFPNTVQFLFVKDREQAKVYAHRVLSNPEIVKEYDLQYLYAVGKF